MTRPPQSGCGELLDRSSYLIQTCFDPERRVDTYDILDGASELPVGFASEIKFGRARDWLRRVLGRNLFPTTVRVFEQDAQTLVFSVRELHGLWCSRLVLADEQGSQVCRFEAVVASIGGGLVVRDRNGHLLGSIEYDLGAGQYHFRGRTSRIVGTIEDRIFAARSFSSEPGPRYSVTIGGASGCGAAASILLLASTLALDVVYRDRMGGAEERQAPSMTLQQALSIHQCFR